MHLSLFIAYRYLFAKKSHNVINIISMISAIGIGIGSLALTVILSVYNGFDNLIKELYESYEADFIITPTKGKSFVLDEATYAKLKGINGVEAICSSIEENVFIKYGDNQSIATIKGIDTAYERVSSISENIVEGEFKSMVGEIPHAIVGEKLAQDLMLRVRFLTPIEIYFPNRKEEISLINPMQNLHQERLFPSGIIRLEQNFDNKHIFAPIEVVRRLIEYNNHEATSVEIYLNTNRFSGEKNRQYDAFYKEAGKQISAVMGGDYVVKDRYRQNETIYKMMKGEKFTVYFILFFVILIISINIFSSLVMLIIDKKEDIATFSSMGAGSRMVRRIFSLQGLLISVLGATVGIGVGLALCFIQQKTGIIQIPGSFIVTAYPVDVQGTDIIITFTGVIMIGYSISAIASRGLKKNI